MFSLFPENKQKKYETSESSPGQKSNKRKHDADTISESEEDSRKRQRMTEINEEIESIQINIQIDPDDDLAYYASANAYQKLAHETGKKGHLDQALRDSDKAIQLEPKKQSYLAQRAKIYHAMGNIDHAKSDWEAASRLRPENGVRRMSTRLELDDLKEKLYPSSPALNRYSLNSSSSNVDAVTQERDRIDSIRSTSRLT